MTADPLLLAPSTRLIHVGPYKTGTTSLQHALHAGRGRLKAHGVHYAGKGTQPMMAALAVVGRNGRKGDRAPRPEDWDELVDEVRAAGDQRVVISSEFLCSGDDAAARRVVQDLGAGGPVHVVLTLRPIAKIAPSQWQQYMQNGVRIPYDEWLRAVFSEPPNRAVTPTFWERHDHAVQIRRWAKAVGPENLTVVVVDETDKDMLLRTFEAFVGLPDGLLVPQRDKANRSLTRSGAELVRLVNEYFHQKGWSDSYYAEYVRDGVARQLRTADRHGKQDGALTMPDWAMEAATRVSERVVEAIESTQVHVVGDPSTLTATPQPAQGQTDARPPKTMPAVTAALAVFGAMTGKRKPRRGAAVAAALSMPSVLAGAEGTDEAGMPLVRVDEAARAVIGVLEGRETTSEFVGLPPVRAEYAALAVLAGSKASGTGTATDVTSDLVTTRRLLDAMAPDVKRQLMPTGGKSSKAIETPAEKATASIRATSAEDVSEAVKDVARRGRKHARRWLHR